MKKLTLLATTALALSIAPAMANENQSWIDTMTTSVQNWWSADAQTSEVEAYLDEVTIAIPPMTGEQAAQIQPAAGDYMEAVEDEILNNDAPVMNAPGSMTNDEQSFNTGFTNETVTAFDDNVMSADDMANIMPAAGDAEKITDEAVVVAEEMMNDTMETASETMDTMHETAETMMDDMVQPAVETQVEEMMEAPVVAEEMMEHSMDAPQEMAMDKVEDTMTDAVEPAAGVEVMTESMTDEAVDMVEEKIEEVAPMATDMMDVGHDMMDDHGQAH
jgi:hypothetical protein